VIVRRLSVTCCKYHPEKRGEDCNSITSSSLSPECPCPQAPLRRCLVARTYLLPTLSHTLLSATLLPMIPRSALISSAGSGRIRKGFGGGSDEKGEAGRMFAVPLLVLFRPYLPTSSVLLPASPPNPLRILPDPADVLSSQPFALLPPQSISSAGCPTVRSGLSPSARHSPAF